MTLCKDFTRKRALALATIGFVPLAAMGNLPLPAKGADYQQPFPDLAPAYDKVEFASGWYVRGDIAYAQETFPTPRLNFRSSLRRIFALAISLPKFIAGNYVDLGTWQGFTPYLGTGAGVTWAQIKQSANWFMSNGLPYQASFNLGPGGNFFFDFDQSKRTLTYHFAWALMAGVAVAVTDHVQLDVGYRFLNLGNFSIISSERLEYQRLRGSLLTKCAAACDT